MQIYRDNTYTARFGVSKDREKLEEEVEELRSYVATLFYCLLDMMYFKYIMYPVYGNLTMICILH